MLLIQYHFLFSERKAAEVRNSRFVNTHGRKGHNRPCDLHMEHLNRRLKDREGIESWLMENVVASVLF